VYIAVVLLVTDYEALETLLRVMTSKGLFTTKRFLEFNRSC